MLALILGCVLGGIALIVIICVLWGIVTFNTFVRMRNKVEEAFSTMDI